MFTRPFAANFAASRSIRRGNTVDISAHFYYLFAFVPPPSCAIRPPKRTLVSLAMDALAGSCGVRAHALAPLSFARRSLARRDRSPTSRLEKTLRTPRTLVLQA